MGLNGFIKLAFFFYGFLFQSFIDPEKLVPGSVSVVFYFGFLYEYGLPKYGLNSNDGITVCQGVLARRVGTLFVDNNYVVCQVDAGPQQVIQAVNYCSMSHKSKHLF